MVKKIFKNNLLKILFVFSLFSLNINSSLFAILRKDSIVRSTSLFNLVQKRFNLSPRPNTPISAGKDKNFIVMSSSKNEEVDFSNSCESLDSSDRKGKVLFDGETVGCLWYRDPSEKSRKEFEKEKKFLEQIKHPNIIKMNGYLDTEEHFLIFTESGTKSLHDYIQERSGIAENISLLQKIKILKDVASGLAYMHKKRYVHRDIKPKNIVLFFDGDQVIAKIIDFTSYEKISKKFKSSFDEDHLLKGTFGYFAPECIRDFWSLEDILEIVNEDKLIFGFDGYSREIEPNDFKSVGIRVLKESDIYSYAILMWELLNNFSIMDEFYSKFKEDPDLKEFGMQNFLFGKIADDSWRPGMIEEDIPESLISLMKRCWNDNLRLRPTANEIYEELTRIEDELIGD